MLHFEDTFTIWNVKDKDYVLKLDTTKNGKEYGTIALSSSSKSKNGDKYEVDWRGFAKLYGNALEKAKQLGLVERNRIKVKGTIQNIGLDKKIMLYPNINIWEIDLVDAPETVAMPKEPEVVGELEPLDISEDQLPF